LYGNHSLSRFGENAQVAAQIRLQRIAIERRDQRALPKQKEKKSPMIPRKKKRQHVARRRADSSRINK
jgi:hypothetical protein